MVFYYISEKISTEKMKKGLHKFKKVCYDNPRWETSIAIWACSSVGSGRGTIICAHIGARNSRGPYAVRIC